MALKSQPGYLFGNIVHRNFFASSMIRVAISVRVCAKGVRIGRSD